MNGMGSDMTETSPWKRAAWIGIIVAASLAFSFALACATPFAALAAVGALMLKPRDALAASGLAWIGNQVVGYGLLAYPIDAESLAWGGVLGLSALFAAGAAIFAAGRTRDFGFTLSAACAFLAAFAAQQLTVLAATSFLPSGDGVFSASVVLLIFSTNALAFATLMALQAFGELTGVAPARLEGTAAARG
jgi:hypothetical protein